MPALIENRYEIVAKLGEGGQGAVYKARHVELESFVALKLLPTHLAAEPDLVLRFRREAKVQARFKHPNIVRVTDIIQDEGLFYLVMDYVEGSDLRRYLRTNGRLSVPIALGIAQQVGDALAYAHDRMVVHRDIKPSNILVESVDPLHVMLFDFGIAKEEGASEHTRTGSLVGSYRYSAPEQLGYRLPERRDQALAIDGRTDVYALGLVLFEMLEGSGFFAGLAEADVIGRVVYDPAPLVPRFTQPIPPDVVAIVTHAMERDPAHRFQSMHELVAALRRTAAAHADGDDSPTRFFGAPRALSRDDDSAVSNEEIESRIRELESERRRRAVVAARDAASAARAQAEAAAASLLAPDPLEQGGEAFAAGLDALEARGFDEAEAHFERARSRFTDAREQATRESARIAEERALEGARRREAERQLEAARRRDEARKLEEARRLDEARARERARLAADVERRSSEARAARKGAEAVLAHRHAPSAFAEGSSLESGADLLAERGELEAAAGRYGEARSTFDEARALAVDAALRGGLEVARRSAGSALEAAIRGGCERHAPVALEHARSIFEQAERAAEVSRLEEATDLFATARQHLEIALAEARRTLEEVRQHEAAEREREAMRLQAQAVVDACERMAQAQESSAALSAELHAPGAWSEAEAAERTARQRHASGDLPGALEAYSEAGRRFTRAGEEAAAAIEAARQRAAAEERRETERLRRAAVAARQRALGAMERARAEGARELAADEIAAAARQLDEASSLLDRAELAGAAEAFARSIAAIDSARALARTVAKGRAEELQRDQDAAASACEAAHAARDRAVVAEAGDLAPASFEAACRAEAQADDLRATRSYRDAEQAYRRAAELFDRGSEEAARAAAERRRAEIARRDAHERQQRAEATRRAEATSTVPLGPASTPAPTEPDDPESDANRTMLTGEPIAVAAQPATTRAIARSGRAKSQPGAATRSVAPRESRSEAPAPRPGGGALPLLAATAAALLLVAAGAWWLYRESRRDVVARSPAAKATPATQTSSREAPRDVPHEARPTLLPAPEMPRALAWKQVSPEGATVTVAEGNALSFEAEIASPGAVETGPSYSWQVDGNQSGQGPHFVLSPGFEEGGTTREVTVVASSAGQQIEHTWRVRVDDVNRPPALLGAVPSAPSIDLAAGATQEFTIEASDPDRGDRLTYRWARNGKEVAAGSESAWTLVEATPDDHEVRVIVTDAAGMPAQSRSWRLAVAKLEPVLEAPPKVIAQVPVADKPIRLREGDTVDLRVRLAGKGKPGETTEVWYLDGKEVRRGEGWRFEAPRSLESDKQKHRIEVEVSARATGVRAPRVGWDVEVGWAPPVIAEALPKGPRLVATAGEVLEFTARTRGTGEVHQEWNVDGRTTVTYDGRLRLPEGLEPGEHEVVVAAIDGRALRSGERSWRVVVQPPATPAAPLETTIVARGPTPGTGPGGGGAVERVKQWLRDYEAALNRKDADTIGQLRGLGPTERESVRASLEKNASLKVTFSNIEVRQTAETELVARYSRVDRFLQNEGSLPQERSSTVEQTFRMRDGQLHPVDTRR